MPPDSIEAQGTSNAESLLGQTLLGAWVPTAVASVGVSTDVLRAEPVQGESKVLVHVVQPTPDVDLDALNSDLENRRRLRHPGVLRLLMSGTLPDGRVVVVTPSTGASSLASHLAMRPPRLPDAIRIASQVGRALQAMHDTCGAYGPLTPEHVLMVPGPDGREDARLLPVWWAWRHGFDDLEASPWQPWRRVNEPHRMADDAFALGALLWHAVAGRAPIDADALDTLTGSVPDPLPPLSSQLRRRIPAALDGIVANLLDPERGERPTNLAVIADRLEDIVHQLEGGGPAIGPPMVMATPVPVGGQLRERSLVLPIPPPAARSVSEQDADATSPAEDPEDQPTAPSGTRALEGLHMPAPRTGLDPSEAVTLIEGDDDDDDDGPPTPVTDFAGVNPLADPDTAPPMGQRDPSVPTIRTTPNSLPDQPAPSGDGDQSEPDEALGSRLPWLAVVAGTGLLGAALLLVLYLFGVFG